MTEDEVEALRRQKMDALKSGRKLYRKVASAASSHECQRSSISLAFDDDVQVIPYLHVHVIPYP
jgi:hypothetical protein